MKILDFNVAFFDKKTHTNKCDCVTPMKRHHVG